MLKLPHNCTHFTCKQNNAQDPSIASLTPQKPSTVWFTTNCWKFLKRWEYQTTCPASWETCMQVKKQQLELDMEQWTGSKLGKEYIKALYCHPPCLTYMQVKEKSEKPGFKLNIQKSKIMPSGPITLWQTNVEKMERVTDFIFSSSKITVDSVCSHEIKRRLFPERKAMTGLDSILKNRDITLPTKLLIFKAMVFPVVMYAGESWTIKKGKHWRTDVFKLWFWRKLLTVPWTARRSNQSILKKINP